MEKSYSAYCSRMRLVNCSKWAHARQKLLTLFSISSTYLSRQASQKRKILICGCMALGRYKVVTGIPECHSSVLVDSSIARQNNFCHRHQQHCMGANMQPVWGSHFTFRFLQTKIQTESNSTLGAMKLWMKPPAAKSQLIFSPTKT